MSVVDKARRYIGSPYVFGANGNNPGERMDCSRFVQNVMRDMGVTISRSTHTQKNEGKAISYNNMQPGDCIYYNGHEEMFIGNGRIIHASPRGVVEQNIYDTKNIITIRRFLPDCIPSPKQIQISFILDLDLYNALHPDLQKAFGGNHGALENHLHTYGLKEGRIFGYVFDPRFYSDKYGDIKNTFGDDFVAVTKHYLDFGINEGRRASNEFDPIYYKNKYSDLQNAFGDHMKSYYQHYLQFGRFEGRQTHD